MDSLFDFGDILFDNLQDDKAEIIPIMSEEDESKMNREKIPDVLPILPLRNTVLFPGVIIPITVGREKSISLIKEVNAGTKRLGVVSQKDPEVDNPKVKDLNELGTLAHVIKLLEMPDGNTTAIIQGKRKFLLGEMVQEKPFFKAKVRPYKETNVVDVNSKKIKVLMDTIREMALRIVKNSSNIPAEAAFAIKNMHSPVFFLNFVSSNLNIDVEEKQRLLEISDFEKQAKEVINYLSKELQVVEIKNQIQNKVKVDLDKQQRDYLLNQQLKTIQEELGGNPSEQEINELTEKSKDKKWTKEVGEAFDKEMKKLKRMNPSAAEYSIQMNYLETMVNLPWGEYTKDNLDLNHAQKVLDKDHFGLEKVKERIIEHLAVVKLKNDLKSPILCLVGPPGVGKTSLGRSVAEAIGRKYVRMSLGGVRDEAELRGHRKTYIGAMPGRIIQNLVKVKSSNPVFVLDEIDKVSGNNINGDPQAALLEILDPEQNTTFYDNFLELEYDLSKVMFIATANTLSTIHPALRDRMEIIDVSGYLMEEKIEIAKRHLLPKQYKEHGLKIKDLSFSKKIIEKLVSSYTRESGVRALEKTIAKVIRNRAKFIAMEEEYNKKTNLQDLEEILGPEKFQRDKSHNNKHAGIVTGLAWTSVGGEILFVEASLSRGKGRLTLTGNLGDVMKESATLAYEYLKSHANLLNLDEAVFEKWNVHIHVPEGATPKDGPSAGITMFTALASMFTQRKIKANLAMTGEITLRGKVLPVGGIKEKILAAKRAKIKHIIVSRENLKNVEEISEKYTKGVEFHYVEDMIDVIDIALLDEKVSNAKLI
jgi:ATP-dependent Lon protease